MSMASTRAYRAIRSAVMNGQFAPGSALTETVLANVAGVSRTPVREAVRQLEAEGLVERSETGRLSVTDWQQADLDDLFTLRAMLEGHAAERAAKRIDTAGLESLKKYNAEIAKAIAKTPDVTAFLEANQSFHATVIAAAASERTSAMLGQLVEQPLVRATAHRYDRALFLRSHEEHEELIAALRRRDGEWARAVMIGHIRRAFHALADVREQN